MQTTKKPYYDLDALKRLPISDYLQGQGITAVQAFLDNDDAGLSALSSHLLVEG